MSITRQTKVYHEGFYAQFNSYRSKAVDHSSVSDGAHLLSPCTGPFKLNERYAGLNRNPLPVYRLQAQEM
ncbi:unnamed protein product [Protopolystoma xenopodis]|uniref:Uncharacterized protein n=1 Tax=Protopolystoma xenopodis TaxID=117903 RepID=A0A448XGR9_9PLAT|nr:unnamed protein product [Protopolystoma xenopodis]